MLLREELLFENIKNERFNGYVQGDIEVPEKLMESFVKISPINKYIPAFRGDIGRPIKAYAEEEEILMQPRRMLISRVFMVKWNNHYTVASLFWGWFINLARHSKEILHQTCSGCSEWYKRGRRKSNSQCCGWDKRVTSKQFIWLSGCGSESTRSNKMSQWCK